MIWGEWGMGEGGKYSTRQNHENDSVQFVVRIVVRTLVCSGLVLERAKPSLLGYWLYWAMLLWLTGLIALANCG